MADRPRCASCAVPLPAGSGRCPSCGHLAGEAVVVAAGRSGPRKRGLVLGVLLVTATLVAVLVGTRTNEGAGRAGQPAEPTTTEASSTTSATSGASAAPASEGTPRPPAGTALAVEPLGGEWPDLGGLKLLRWAQSGPGELIDPVGGVVTALQLATPGPIGPIVARLDGAVVVAAGRAVFRPRLPGTEDAVDLGAAEDVIASDLPTRVWLVTHVGDDRRLPELREVDVVDGSATDPVTLPVDARPVAGVVGGLLVQGPDGGYVIDRGGRARRITHGQVIDASATTALLRTCDEELRCSHQLLDLHAATERRVVVDAELDWWEMHLAPTGTAAAGIGHDGEHGWRLVVVDFITGDRHDHVLSTAGSPPATASVTWSPDGRWLIMGRESGLSLFRAADGAEAVIERPGSPTAVTVIG